jgi:hypothetical protein
MDNVQNYTGVSRWRTWLMHYATSRKVAGFIANKVTGFSFHLPNPSSRIKALGLTQPLTEMNARNLPV